MPTTEPCHVCRTFADLTLKLADRIAEQSELLSRRAEADPLRQAAEDVHDALCRYCSYAPGTLTLIECRDRLAEVLGKTELTEGPKDG